MHFFTKTRPKTRLQALESAKKSIQALPATGARPKTRLQARTKLVYVSDHRLDDMLINQATFSDFKF